MCLKFSGSKDILVRVHSTNSLHFFCKNCTTKFLYTGEQSRGGKDRRRVGWKGRVGYGWMRGTYLQAFICLIWGGFMKGKSVLERAIERFVLKQRCSGRGPFVY
jgi:hypothetical protein